MEHFSGYLTLTVEVVRANIISHGQRSLQRINATLEDRDFDVCAISLPF